MTRRPAVLLVCLGNICRSPLAEAAVRAEAARIGLDLDVDSAGTGGWHAGDAPDRRAQAVALRHGIDISAYRARQVTPADFTRFTHIVALDEDNLADLRRLAPAGSTATIGLLLDHVPARAGQGVRDPYYGNEDGFDATWDDVTAGARGLVRAIAEA